MLRRDSGITHKGSPYLARQSGDQLIIIQAQARTTLHTKSHSLRASILQWARAKVSLTNLCLTNRWCPCQSHIKKCWTLLDQTWNRKWPLEASTSGRLAPTRDQAFTRADSKWLNHDQPLLSKWIRETDLNYEANSLRPIRPTVLTTSTTRPNRLEPMCITSNTLVKDARASLKTALLLASTTQLTNWSQRAPLIRKSPALREKLTSTGLTVLGSGSLPLVNTITRNHSVRTWIILQLAKNIKINMDKVRRLAITTPGTSSWSLEPKIRRFTSHSGSSSKRHRCTCEQRGNILNSILAGD